MDKGWPKVTLRIPDDVIFRVLGDEAVILNLATGTYFGLNSMGTRIWQLIAEHGTKDKVIERLWAEYEVEENQLSRDFDFLISQLQDRGLLTTDGQELPKAG